MNERENAMTEGTLYSFLQERRPQCFNAPILYHYTSFGKFSVFFKKDADLYCTHFAALNDGNEIGQGWEIVVRYLNENMDWKTDKCNLIWNYYKKGIRENKIVSPWIMSFSLAKDSLPQWIGYTDKKEGGFALGFDAVQLQEVIKEMSRVDSEARKEKGEEVAPFRMYILPCLYSGKDANVITELLSRYINQDVALFNRVRDDKEPDVADKAKIIAKLLLVSAIIKHDSFCHEKEMRLIIQPTSSKFDDCDFIGGKPRWKTNIAQYVKSPLCGLIKEIWVSPHGDRQVLLTSAQIMAAKHGLSCEIKESSSPYNGR